MMIKKHKKLLLLIVILVILVILAVMISEMNLYVKEKQWCYENYGQTIEGEKGKKGIDINIKGAEELLENKEIVVAVIDSGIDFSSEVLLHAPYINEQEVVGNGIDDDNNGYIDDIHGWNFYDNNNEIYSNYTSDFHGTMIAGIIAGNNVDKTRFGVSTNIKILTLKCFRGTKGDISDVVRAIEYGYNMGVRIFNCSWDTMTYDAELFSIMKKYSDAIFVCSGGKYCSDLIENPVYPACYNLDNVICVGAIDSSGNTFQFSGYGEAVDVYAPGVGIYCVMPENTYVYSEGTSLATAFVTGGVALAYSQNKEIGIKRICELLRSSDELNMLDIGRIMKRVKE